MALSFWTCYPYRGRARGHRTRSHDHDIATGFILTSIPKLLWGKLVQGIATDARKPLPYLPDLIQPGIQLAYTSKRCPQQDRSCLILDWSPSDGSEVGEDSEPAQMRAEELRLRGLGWWCLHLGGLETTQREEY